MAFQGKVQWLEDTQLAEPFVLTDTVGRHPWRDRAAVELSTWSGLFSLKILTSMSRPSNHNEPEKDLSCLYPTGLTLLQSDDKAPERALGILGFRLIFHSVLNSLASSSLPPSPLNSFHSWLCLTSQAFIIVHHPLISRVLFPLVFLWQHPLLIFLCLSPFPLFTNFSFFFSWPLNADLLFDSFLGWCLSFPTPSVYSISVTLSFSLHPMVTH